MSYKRRKLSHEFQAVLCTDSNDSNLEIADGSVDTKGRTRSFHVPSGNQQRKAVGNQEIDSIDTERHLQDPCPICLENITDLALTFPCNHAYDHNCICRWTDISTACPLCKTELEFLVYDIHGKSYKKKSLQRIRGELDGTRSIGEIRRRRRLLEQERRFRRRSHSTSRSEESRILERDAEIALERRKYIYENGLTASHVGTNRHSNFRSFTVQEIQDNKRNLKGKAAMFLRRELQVFAFLTENHEFTLQYIMDGVLTRLDIQSSGTHKLVGDLLGDDKARILLHELRTFLRSPFEDLRSFDRSMLIQYRVPLLPAWPDRHTTEK